MASAREESTSAKKRLREALVEVQGHIFNLREKLYNVDEEHEESRAIIGVARKGLVTVAAQLRREARRGLGGDGSADHSRLVESLELEPYRPEEDRCDLMLESLGQMAAAIDEGDNIAALEIYLPRIRNRLSWLMKQLGEMAPYPDLETARSLLPSVAQASGRVIVRTYHGFFFGGSVLDQLVRTGDLFAKSEWNGRFHEVYYFLQPDATQRR